MNPDGKKKTLAMTLGVVVFMGVMAWAAVPLYDLFCRVTGYGGRTAVSASGAHEVLDRTIKVRFDASLERGMPWTFKPVQREMELKIGETGLAFYEVYNPTDRPVTGTANYNVAPFSAGSYFAKIACFCFNEQVLQPGERAQLPITFYIDPAIVDDPEAKYVKTITLSYTFHELQTSEGRERKQASLAAQGAAMVTD